MRSIPVSPRGAGAHIFKFGDLAVVVGLSIFVLATLAGCSAPTSEAEQAEAEPPSGRPLPPLLQGLDDEVRRHPDKSAARRKLATALHDAGFRDEALPHFERLAREIGDRRSLLDLALAYGSVSQLKRAEATYRRLLSKTPGDPVALHNLGNLALKTDRIDEAIQLYLEAVRRKPGYILARLHIGEAFERAGRFKEAYRAYESVLNQEPTDAQQLEAFDEALYRMAALDMQMGALERAVSMLDEVLKNRPDHPNAHYAYGQTLVRLGRADEALQAFERHRRLLDEQTPTAPAALLD